MGAFLNCVSTSTPSQDIHHAFLDFAVGSLPERRDKLLFQRMATKSQIDHRWSVLGAGRQLKGEINAPADFYRVGAFPSTAQRMQVYEKGALELAMEAVQGLRSDAKLSETTHLIIVSCTGFSAPGLDLQIVERCGLRPSTERTIVGFMGCYAALNALRLARHIVRSESSARVLIVSVELCTLHLQEPETLEQALSFLVFGDGCAAAMVTGEPVGFELDRFQTILAQEAGEQITWTIRDRGFEMYLSGQVPNSVASALRSHKDMMLDGSPLEAIDHWAVHPGGRSVLDAVEHALELHQGALGPSRDVLRRFGNMSSATVLYILKDLLQSARPRSRGCAMGFGPGLTAETMLFTCAG